MTWVSFKPFVRADFEKKCVTDLLNDLPTDGTEIIGPFHFVGDQKVKRQFWENDEFKTNWLTNWLTY